MLVDIRVEPEQLEDENLILQKVKEKAGKAFSEASMLRLIKRSLDARGRNPVYQLRYEVLEQGQIPIEPLLTDRLSEKQKGKTALIIGAGPAGYFAALHLLTLGIKPIVVDRGKDVRSRRRDLKAIQQEGIVNPDSNYCFGEGGAGTYSDGKLYTRSHKRGDIHEVLKWFVEHGATEDILIDAHPHIGTNKLPQIVSAMRDSITAHGGEVHFQTRITQLIIHAGILKGVVTADGEKLHADAVILATGHSARDIYYMLHHHQLHLEAKPFALGVRVEHPQSLIDEIQYKRKNRGQYLPPSSYSLTCQVNGRGVFSFCMCPGGMVVPAATSPGEIVINGMSPSRRDSPFSNSGLVVAVENEDLEAFAQHGPFANMLFQQSVEQAVFHAGNGTQQAPALRMTDFVNKRLSSDLPPSSYIPGLYPGPLYEILPGFIYTRLREALVTFSKQMKGFYTADANVIATESRSSAPVKIPRDIATCMHPQLAGLFPCGEGAGYAGGIVSAAMDGIRVADKVHVFVTNS